MLKYQTECDAVGNCPVKDQFKARINVPVYRFVHDDTIKDRRNFLPVAKLDPHRTASMPTSVRCISLALSMFDSEFSAKAHFNGLKQRNKNIGKRIGEKLAYAKLDSMDGISDPPSSKGHISFFEYAGSMISSKFSKVCDL